jgi:hypothetical protein
MEGQPTVSIARARVAGSRASKIEIQAGCGQVLADGEVCSAPASAKCTMYSRA